MPEMKTYTVNGVTYDLRDPTKAPAGYGLGYECVNIDSVVNINKNGWWVTNGDTPDGDYWECISLVVNGGTCVVVHAWNYDRNLQAVRTKRNGTWGEWVDCTPSAFAPSGYGLGTVQPIEWSNIDNITANGWYSAVVNGEIAPGAATYMVWVRVDALDTNYACQTAYITGGDYVLKRHRHMGAWGEWEWVNPPMSLGVEYRTTERYQGAPVYVCLLHVGYLAKGDNSIEHKLNMLQPISVDVFNNSQELLTGYSGITNLTVNRNYIYMSATSAFGNIQYYLKYMKA